MQNLRFVHAFDCIASRAPGRWKFPQSLAPEMKAEGTSIVRRISDGFCEAVFGLVVSHARWLEQASRSLSPCGRRTRPPEGSAEFSILAAVIPSRTGLLGPFESHVVKLSKATNGTEGVLMSLLRSASS